MSRRPGAAGFTLLEVLLTLTLVGAAVAMAGGGLHLGRRAWEATDRRFDRLEQTTAAHALIRQSLGQALPARLVASASPLLSGPLFIGRPASVAFLAARPAGALAGGPHRVTVTVAGPPGAQSLFLSVDPPDRTATLLDGVVTAAFAYYGIADDTGLPRWFDAWDRANRLPDLVRVSATLADGTAWPDLVVALPLR